MSRLPELVLVGADMQVTTLSIRTVKSFRRDDRVSRRGAFRQYRYFRATCSCGRLKHEETWDHINALVRTEVHARLWHGAEPDRRWKR